MKKCNKCKRPKNESCFSKSRKAKDGLQGTCKVCDKDRQKKYKQTPQGRKNKRLGDKRYRKTKKGKLTNRKARLKDRFGLTLKEYDQMFEAQGGVCAICGKKETAKNRYGLKHLAVDHNHETKQVRGLLCDKCNLVIGWAKDDKERLLKAALYLEK